MPRTVHRLTGRRSRPVPRSLLAALAAPLAVAIALAGCGVTNHPSRAVPRKASQSAASETAQAPGTPQAHPQVVEPVAGEQAIAVASADPTDSAPVGDPNAHAPPLSEVESELKNELVAARATSASYIDPLQYVNHWERTDQGVDANLPVGAPILAPGTIKILAIEPDWYAGQPLVYWELLSGPDAGRVQYVAEEITDIAAPGSILQQGQPIARYAATGTGIEFGWSTPSGITLAVATTGYEEGEATPAGKSMRQWLNSLGANAGSS
jgi:hypothetical protein